MIEAIQARLRATVPALKLVGDAVGFQSAAERTPTVMPACYVITLGEKPSPNSLGNILIQQVQASIGVILVMRNLGDATGAKAQASIEALRGQVKDQIFGWVPKAGCEPLERGDSNLLAFRDGCVWWQDIYVTSFYDRSKQ
ncbi:hypothetical protein [Massilia sp. NR 4-1]|uniref:phage tail terminator protein n=1 Tax=Massilia sp. NR 4-1 TaxID=1678028 RepID=UPI00067C75BB|nr:hypothetical protein [Massilia sp. NR 4-1]AKU21876.1 hypothetical protein ACZ75_10755 [Massilia sp. NR 4-1]